MKKYRSWIFVWILLTSLLSPSLCAQSLADKINALIDQKLPKSSIGILIQNLNTGETLYSKNPNQLLSPASSMKLLTAAASLYQLGPNYHFLTEMAQKGQNVYLKFSGAPDLKTTDLEALLSHLKKAGIQSIQGNIILDHSRFKAPYYPAGVSYDDLGWYFAAPVTAVILNENAQSYDFISAPSLGSPIQIKAKTPGKGLTIINRVLTQSKEDEKEHCALNIEIQPENKLLLSGCLAKSDRIVNMQLAIPDPIFFAKQLINHYLQDNHIQLKGQILSGLSPSDAQLIASIQSKTLPELIRPMLKDSNNLYANALARTLAAVLTGEGSDKQAAFALKKVLAEHSSLDLSELKIADGMGTRYNLVTAQQMVKLLRALYQDKDMRSLFLSALPQAGASGTLKDRMNKTSLNKIVFAKTGTMHDISSLSGYLLKPGADPLVFSILINGVNKPIKEAKALEEQILELIQE